MPTKTLLETTRLRSFLKWPGGKFLLLDRILPILHRYDIDGRLVEPFGGTGVVSLNAGFAEALVADNNPDLVIALQVAQSDPQELIAECQKLFTKKGNTPREYYRRREEFNTLAEDRSRPIDRLRLAALFVYLNKHCFNGLVRYNAKGGFNSPFGHYANPQLPTAAIEAHARAVSEGGGATFVCQDFVQTMRDCKRGAVVYCDPPYVPLSKTASFTAFSAGGFGLEEQERLAAEARALAARGIPCIISNHDTPVARKLYRGAKITSFDVRRSISCDAATRGCARELIAVFGAS